MTTIKSTIVASIDSAAPHAFYSELEAEEVVATLESDKFIKCEGPTGDVYLASSLVKYVQAGKGQPPVSSSPSSGASSSNKDYVGTP